MPAELCVSAAGLLSLYLQGLEGRGEARTWLLPLMRLHVRGARLAVWGQQLMPLARTLANRSLAAAK